MPKTAMIRARIEPGLKTEAERILAGVGLTPTEAIRLFYRQVSLHGGLPFEVRMPNAATRIAVAEARSGKMLKAFRSAAALPRAAREGMPDVSIERERENAVPTIAVGIDGCRGGWIAVVMRADGRNYFRILGNIAEVAAIEPTAVAIDIPIGLPETGIRDCDQVARESLEGGRNRVFLGVRRPLLRYVDNFNLANAWGMADGRGVSKQLFCILPKIAEVDAYLRTRTSTFPIRETHPELAFKRINNSVILSSKKSEEGKIARRNLLIEKGFDQIDSWLGLLRGTGAKADDLLDACACALVAQTGIRLPSELERDAHDLPMEMWY